MPPKKGKKGKEPKPAKAGPSEAPEETDVSKIELLDSLQKELDKERKERNYAQLEMDHLQALCETEEKQLNVLTAEMSTVEEEITLNERRYHEGYKVSAQERTEHLQQQNSTMSKLKAEIKSVRTLRFPETIAESVEMEAPTQLEHKDLEQLQLDLEMELCEKRNDLEKQLREIEANYKNKLKTLEGELENSGESELTQRQDHWNSLSTALIIDHNQIFNDTIARVTQTGEKGLALYGSLKRQNEELQVKLKEKQKELSGVLQDIEFPGKAFLKVKQDMDNIQKKMKYPIKAKNPNERVKDKELNDLKEDYEELEEKFCHLQTERDELRLTLNHNVRRVQHCEQLKTMLLKEKYFVLVEKLQQNQALPIAPAPTEISSSTVEEATEKRGRPEEVDTRHFQVLSERLQDMEDLLQRNAKTAERNRIYMVQIINEKNYELHKLKMQLEERTVLLQKSTKPVLQRIWPWMEKKLVENMVCPAPPKKMPTLIPNDEQPMGVLEDQIVRVASENGAARLRDHSLLPRQLELTEQLLRTHAEMTTKNRADLIHIINRQSDMLHAVKKDLQKINQHIQQAAQPGAWNTTSWKKKRALEIVAQPDPEEGEPPPYPDKWDEGAPVHYPDDWQPLGCLEAWEGEPSPLQEAADEESLLSESPHTSLDDRNTTSGRDSSAGRESSAGQDSSAGQASDAGQNSSGQNSDAGRASDVGRESDVGRDSDTGRDSSSGRASGASK